jgi:nucleoside-diphosphate-sugar epimerase
MPLALVTGACGAIGNNLVDLLLEKRYKVRATDLEKPTGVTVCDRERIESCGAEFIPSDLTKPETLEKTVKDVDIVFHLASILNYATPWEVMERVNVQGTKNLCEVIAKTNPDARLIHWSSGEVYGFGMMDASRLPPSGELTEEAQQKPGESPYAKSKHLQEQVVWGYSKEKGLKVTVLRLASVYGPGTFIDTLLFFAITRGIVGAFPKYINFRWPLVHVKDVIASSVFLAEKDVSVGEAYNIADDQNYTIAEVIYAIAFATGNKLYNPPLPIHMSKVTRITKAFIPLARRAAVRRINNVKKKGKTPVFETFTISAYMDTIKEVEKFSDDFKFSNRKLKGAGYELLYPDYRYSVYETAEWYRARGYI